MKPLRVLSLFDGISCGQVALERAGIPVEVYYASEIDKYAIQITQKNYPNTIQLGDVEKIDFTQYEGKIDLLIGGSPCTNLSICGNRKGLEGDESRLFWEYVRAIKECKPKYFLLENVESMADSDREIISKELGCYPIMINSSLVSAQNCKRYYWFNWGDMQYNLFGFPTCDIPQPQNKGILLKDVLESGYAPDDKSRCIQSSIGRTTTREYFKKNQGQMVAEPITPYVEKKYKEFAEQNRYIPKMFNPYNLAEIEDKSPALTAQGNSQTKSSTVMMFEPLQLGHISNTNAQANRVYSVHNKSVTLKANGGGGGSKTGLYKIDLPDGEYLIRKLTPLECERLQTLPDNYTEYGTEGKISNTQRYKAIGNGWTVDVVAHIFSFLKVEV